jgi:oligopeptide transport system substrate-binding protein
LSRSFCESGCLERPLGYGRIACAAEEDRMKTTKASASRLGRGKLLLSLLLALLALVAFACTSDSGPDAAEVQQFRLRLSGDPTTFDPQLAYESTDISVVKQLFRGLFTYDEDLNVVPAVALEVPTKENGGISDDGLTYTIKLRDDTTWSDGAPVTADDFVYTFQRLFDPDAGAQGYYFGFYTAIVGAGEFAGGEGTADGVGVTAVDERTLQIDLVQPQPTLPVLLALWPAAPLRRDVIEQHGADWTDAGNLIGNGPFVLTDYSIGDSITLEANPAYWGDDKPTLERVVYKIIPDDSAALLAYENGEIDMTSIPLPDASRYEGDAEQVRYAQLETFALQYNTQAAPLDDPLVRQAISRAIDRDAYVATVLSGVGQAALGWLPPGMPGYEPSVGEDVSFDEAAAGELLGEAGYPGADGFPTITLTIADAPPTRLTAEFVQEQLKQHLGIELKIEALEEGVYNDRLNAGDFQIIWQSWFADYADPENWLAQQFATDGAFNLYGYSNPQVDDLLAQAAVELDQAKRLALYDQAHRQVIDDQVVTPIFHPERNYLVKGNVDGLVFTGLDAEPGDWFESNVRILATDGAPPASGPE